jgi:transposase
MITLLRAIEAMYPGKRRAQLVQVWLMRPGCRVKLHFIPTYCPHLDPIERLWSLMHKHVTRNRCHATFADFKADIYCDQVTDNSRIISPGIFEF